MRFEDILVGVFIVVAIGAGVCAWWFENKSTGAEHTDDNDKYVNNVVTEERNEK